MPIEIRELVIKAHIEEPTEAVHENVKIQYEDIVSECVEQVLQVLKEKGER